MNRKRYRKVPVMDLFGVCRGYECPEKGIKIVECEKAEADRIIIANHYSHKVTKNSFVSLLVLYHGKVSGALQCGYGIRPKIKWGGVNVDQVREFDRMWLSDEMPKFSETITLSLFHQYMRVAHPEVKMLISYADTTAGNNGTIYKAANYELVDKLRADFLPVGKWGKGSPRNDVAQTQDKEVGCLTEDISRNSENQGRIPTEICVLSII